MIFNKILLLSSLLLVGCGITGKRGQLSLKLSKTGSLNSATKVIYKSSERDFWVQKKLNDFSAREIRLFESKFNIADAKDDGSLLILHNGHYPGNRKGSGLYLYYTEQRRMIEIPRAPNGYHYDHVALSPDNSKLVASASVPYMRGNDNPIYEDSVFIVDIRSLSISRLKNYWGDAQITSVHWDKSGETVYNGLVNCQKIQGEMRCQTAFLKRDIENDLVISLGEGEKFEEREKLSELKESLQPKHRFYNRSPPPKLCIKQKVRTIVKLNHRLSPHNVDIVLLNEGKKDVLLTISDRIESTAHARPIIRTSPQLAPDCKYITFNHGEDILGFDIFRRKLFFIGAGTMPVIFH